MLKRIQRAGAALFQHADAVLNRAFGEHLNPLYHLGTLAWWLFWVVVASGLYLYVFFRTGINEAYRSVEHLTLGQWWLGGIMRSVHRYASDALVLVASLHLARHFVFDHHRGFRSMSWITGAIVLGLLYVTGVNGFMLPWDRLAQFVVIASAELLDWLPVFDGALIRNFIAQGGLNDRLWSLLSFMHIGLPLSVLALMWIHTQRVAGARTLPPQALAVGTSVGMVLLALVRPVVSEGGAADLTSAVSPIGLDWFYLWALAALYEWGPALLWVVLGAGAFLVFAAPWLPPKRSRAGGFHMLAHPDNRIVPVRASERLLEAALRASLPVAYECRYGGCGLCKATLLSGRVDHGAYQEDALTATERKAGRILLCSATPLSDVEIEYEPAQAPDRVEIRTCLARVARMDRLAPDVMRILLDVEGGVPEFYAGQYVNILLDDGERRSYSFANPPHEHGMIELHIRAIPGGRYSEHVFNVMKTGDALRFEGPLGAFFLREEGDKPVIFVAGATGFAPVKSMLEHAFHAGVKRRMVLYWGTRTLADLYLRELPERWAREHPNFTFIPVLSEPHPEDEWHGRTGLVHDAILADYPDLAGHQVYACGSVAMIQSAHPAFVARGLSEHDCFSDAFTPAPRPRRLAPELVRLGGRA
ncbi:MAG: cytochrome b N-terminal domain-containing protein [Burkholderiales bacterium]|nr:cytochrome b N-terminal domain-containing protein [Burkholderiales bacterium]